MQEVQAVCDRIIIINKGKIIADEPKEDLGKQISEKTVLTVELEADAPDFSEWLLSHTQAALIDSTHKDNHWKLEFEYPTELDLQRDLSQFISAKQWLILSMFKQQHSLEEIFHLLTTESYAEPIAEIEADVPAENEPKEDEKDA
jgi:ABC-2 type transport system ATP-binding protein